MNDGFGDRTGSSREFSKCRRDPSSEIIACPLDVYGIEIQIPPHLEATSNLRLKYPETKNRYWNELRDKDPYHSPESFDEADYGSIEETLVRQSTTHWRSQYDTSEDCILITERNWIDITVNRYWKKYTLETNIPKLVIKMTRHMILQERESDGAVHWKSMASKLRCAFLKDGGDTFSDFDWIIHIWKGSSKIRFQYCKNSCDDLLYIRAIECHTGGEVIASELMGHVAIPIEWKEFLFQRGYSFNTNPRCGTHRCEKESKEGRQTVFFTPWDPWRDETEEEFDDDLLKSRTIHYQSKWKYSQNVVYWIHVTKT